MMTEQQRYQLKIHNITIEDLVPKGHLPRKAERIVKWDFIYEAVRELYSGTIGRPSIDSVVLVKYLLVGFLYGIESERRIEQEIDVNMAYRWFLGLNIGDRVPDHSTISQNRRRRFNGVGVFRQILEEIVRQCMEEGLVEGKVIPTDSTYVKANASRRRNIKVEVQAETTDYMRRLDAAEAEERQRLEQVELKREDFLYDEEADQFVCPRGKRLALRSLERTEHNICRLYRAERADCQPCSLYSQCVASSHYSCIVRVNSLTLPQNVSNSVAVNQSADTSSIFGKSGARALLQRRRPGII